MTEEKKKPTINRLPPVITLDAKFFWDEANNENLSCEKCSDCGEFRFPPRPMCPHCNSVNTDVVPLSGKGTVYSWIRPQHPPAMGFTSPPVAALIDLEEGFRMVSNVVECEFEDVHAGMPVEVTYALTMKNKKIPVFKPAESS